MTAEEFLELMKLKNYTIKMGNLQIKIDGKEVEYLVSLSSMMELFLRFSHLTKEEFLAQKNKGKKLI